MRNSKSHDRAGFEPLALELGAVAEGLDLHQKFEVRESDSFSIDPRTGAKVWAEPYLALYVSLPQGPLQSRTLHYGLTRSKWASQVSVAQQDKQRLLELAKPRIKEALEKLRSGEEPGAFTETEML